MQAIVMRVENTKYVMETMPMKVFARRTRSESKATVIMQIVVRLEERNDKIDYMDST